MLLIRICNTDKTQLKFMSKEETNKGVQNILRTLCLLNWTFFQQRRELWLLMLLFYNKTRSKLQIQNTKYYCESLVKF